MLKTNQSVAVLRLTPSERGPTVLARRLVNCLLGLIAAADTDATDVLQTMGQLARQLGLVEDEVEALKYAMDELQEMRLKWQSANCEEKDGSLWDLLGMSIGNDSSGEVVVRVDLKTNLARQIRVQEVEQRLEARDGSCQCE